MVYASLRMPGAQTTLWMEQLPLHHSSRQRQTSELEKTPISRRWFPESANMQELCEQGGKTVLYWNCLLTENGETCYLHIRTILPPICLYIFDYIWGVYLWSLILIFGFSPNNLPLPDHLREYPIRFGFQMVDIFDDLTGSARGRAAVPNKLPAAVDSFLGMPEKTNALEFARLDLVFNYLRRGRNLQIPIEWKHLVPKPTWPGAVSL